MALLPRQTQDDSADKFLDLIANPFQAQIQVNSIYASIIWAFAVSGGLFIIFVLLRPRNSKIYAPRAKHADQKHAPPTLEKTLFAWIQSIKKVDEQELVEKIGLDAVVFLRFLRMLFNVFLVFSFIGCAVIIPINLVGGHEVYDQWSNVATLMKFTPQYIFGQKFWAYVALAYVFQGILFFFIWWNYRRVLSLRRAYFNSQDYRTSLHSRTLLITHLPESYRSDDGLAQLTAEVKPSRNVPRTAVARNVKDLPELMKQHDAAVRKLESYLAKYLANPDKLPEKRPTCKVEKSDKQDFSREEEDAIDYLRYRIRRLELTIEEVRKTIDRRHPMSYGFASYTHIEDAHSIAYATRKKTLHGSTIRLAAKPNDLIWQNLAMSRATRRTRMFWDGLWMVLLTIAFIPLNILSSVFLSDFSHLGLLWPSFNENLQAHPIGWGIAQGILAPTFQYLIFLVLPTVFRRLYNHAGDASKTSRERHVMTRLFAFFIINNLIVFSVFGSAFRFLAAVIEAKDQNIWDTIQHAHPFTNVMTGLCNVSTFWLTYQMQQNLGAAIDISQLIPLLLGWLRKKFTFPTPRQLIELSAPPPFDYASYYNNYLFVATVGFCFGILQPIIFPVTAFYLLIELWFKRYLLQYVLITKTESGGLFWHTLVNRLLFSILLCNAVIALIVGAQGVGAHGLIEDTAANAAMLYTMIPLPFLVWGFKYFCSRRYDNDFRYYSTSSVSDLEGSGDITKLSGNDRVVVRFGHPALYRTLIKPIVHAKSQHLLGEILGDDGRGGSVAGPTAAPYMFGYSDMYMEELALSHTVKPTQGEPQSFEFVEEEDIDFENFKKRTEFRDEFGGDGELYGKPDDMISRAGTSSTLRTFTGLDEWQEHAQVATRESSRTQIGEEDIDRREDDAAGNWPISETTSAAQPINRQRAGSVDVNIPEARLDVGEILQAGRHSQG